METRADVRPWTKKQLLQAELDLGGLLSGLEDASALADALQGNSEVEVLRLDFSFFDRELSAVAAILRGALALKELHLVSSAIDDEGAVVLSDALRFSNLQILDLSANQIGPRGASFLASVLSNESSSLLDLRLGRNALSDEGAELVGFMLGKNKSLTRLDLRENFLGSEGMRRLANALAAASSACGQLLCVSLQDNEIGDDGAVEIGKLLHSSLPKLAHLFLERNCIGNVGLVALGEGLKSSNLATLILGFNNIGDTGVAALGGAMLQCSTLTELDLASNNISGAGAASVAESLRTSNLRVLKLGCNTNVHDAGISAVAGALLGNNSLQTLDLSDTGATDSGALALLVALKENSCLTDLNLSSNHLTFGMDGMRNHLVAALGFCGSALSRLHLGSNNIGSKGTKSIAKAISCSRTVTLLNLENNPIDDFGALKLADMLRVNSTLEELSLNSITRSCISIHGYQALEAALFRNSTLRQLRVARDDVGVRITPLLKENSDASSDAIRRGVCLVFCWESTTVTGKGFIPFARGIGVLPFPVFQTIVKELARLVCAQRLLVGERLNEWMG